MHEKEFKKLEISLNLEQRDVRIIAAMRKQSKWRKLHYFLAFFVMFEGIFAIILGYMLHQIIAFFVGWFVLYSGLILLASILYQRRIHSLVERLIQSFLDGTIKPNG